jgi:predicted phosphodiesterase
VGGVKAWLVLPDIHVPYHDPIALDGVLRYARGQRWEGCIQLGDFLDFEEISRFNAGSPGAIQGSVSETFKEGRKVLKGIVDVVRARNKDARIVMMEGNHEYRATAYTQKHPELGDVLNVPKGLGLREAGVEWFPSWSSAKTTLRVGNAYFMHGQYVNKYHAAKNAEVFGDPIYYGHTHDVQEFCKVRLAKGKTVEAASLGCLCQYEQPYLKGWPTNWQQAFGVFYFFPDGYFNRYTIRIFKGRFVGPDGRVYVGRAKR